MSQEIKHIEGYSLFDFMLQVQDAVRDGYSISDSNEGMPQTFGPSLFTCLLIKCESKVEEVEQEPIKARKSKKSTNK